ncbi:DMT family transporter [Brevibacillus fluminis]|uniref:DMT family transporter n=1 Tax=Brevibacillus fluminis TaxID=511487 RepID=A0A3M8DP78_9BACL|nr:DMT family transporter [Brevibacillus fluminis]RNB89926.1 DMT family transporter [Brevibacillus fluminis]
MVKGYLYALLSTFCFALPTVFTVFAYQDGLTPQSLVFNQTLIAAILLTLYIKWIGVPLPRPTLRSTVDFFLAGAGKAITVMAMFMAISVMDVSLVMTLIFMYPASVVLLELFIDKKRLNPQQIAGLFCTLAGELFVLEVFQGDFSQLSAIGILLGLVSGLAWGWMIYWSNKQLGAFPPLIVTGYTTIVSVVLYLIMMPPLYLFTTPITLPMIGWSLFFGVIAQVVALLFMFTGINRIGAARFSIISVCELPITVLLAFLLLGEQMDAWQLIGGGLILSGIVLFDWAQFHAALVRSEAL